MVICNLNYVLELLATYGNNNLDRSCTLYIEMEE